MFWKKNFFCEPLFFLVQELRKSVQVCTVEISATPTQRKKSCKQLLSQKSNSMPLFRKSKNLKKSTTKPAQRRARFAGIWLQRVAPAKQSKLQKNRACRKGLTFTAATMTKSFQKWKHLGRLPDLAGKKFCTRPHGEALTYVGVFLCPKVAPLMFLASVQKVSPQTGPQTSV